MPRSYPCQALVEDDDSRLSDARTPVVHAVAHKAGGGDAIKLDELAAPTDVTTLDASTAAHGLLPKLPGGTSTFLRADGAFAAPTAEASVNIKQVEVDFGTALHQRAKSFTITDADVSPGSQLIVHQALDAATGKAQDENEMDTLLIRAAPGTGQFTAFVESLCGSVAGAFKLNYLVG